MEKNARTLRSLKKNRCPTLLKSIQGTIPALLLEGIIKQMLKVLQLYCVSISAGCPNSQKERTKESRLFMGD